MKGLNKAEKFCSELGITILDAENKLSEIKPNEGKYFSKKGCGSTYLMPLYFSVASLIMKDAANILEIGTGAGDITNLLAGLFPSAIVYTVDIPISDKDYEKQALRVRSEEKMERFKRNIISRDNIKYIEKNSFFLSSMGLPREFDLVYVDGGHWYPVIAWDVMFAYNYLRPGGFAFFHDYGGRKRDVKMTIDYIRDIVDEEIKVVVSSTTGGGVAWFRKLTEEVM